MRSSRRHESLRTTFQTLQGEPVQVVEPALHVPLVRIDLSGLPAMLRESEAVRLAIEEARRPFDLARGPLLRTTLLTLSDHANTLLLTMHHIVCDAWSMVVFGRELIALYTAFAQEAARRCPTCRSSTPTTRCGSASGCASRCSTAAGLLARRLARAADAAAADRSAAAGAAVFRGRAWYVPMPADLRESVQRFSQQQGATLFMTLLAAFVALLHRYSGQDDIVVGAPVADRNRPETRGSHRVLRQYHRVARRRVGTTRPFASCSIACATTVSEASRTRTHRSRRWSSTSSRSAT